jgi:hypothetical protein
MAGSVAFRQAQKQETPHPAAGAGFRYLGRFCFVRPKPPFRTGIG